LDIEKVAVYEGSGRKRDSERERGKERERDRVEVVENRHGAIPTSSAKLTLRNHGVSRRLLFNRADDFFFFFLFS
jgi:hypothetical protein